LPDVALRWLLVEDCFLEEEDARERDDGLERELLDWELERDDLEALLRLLERLECRASAVSIGANTSNAKIAVGMSLRLSLDIVLPFVRKW
jgi:hypothetical protein